MASATDSTSVPSTRQLIRTYIACLTVIGVLFAALTMYVLLEAHDMVALGDRAKAAADPQAITQKIMADVQMLRTVQLLFTGAFLSTLMLMGRFALVPATRALRSLLKEQASTRVALEEQAARLSVNAEELAAQNQRFSEQHLQLLDSQAELMAQHETLTEQRAALQDRTTTLSRFALTLEATPDIVVMIGIDGTMLYQNPSAMRLMPGIAMHHGVSLFRFLSRESAREMRFDVIPAVMAHGSWHGEMHVRAGGDKTVPMDMTVLVQRDSYDCPEVFVVTGHDMSEERQLRNSLSEREALNRAVIDSLAEGVVVQDRDGRIVAWNESAERILGLTGDQLSGRTAADSQWNALSMQGAPILPSEHPSTRARVHGERVDGQLMRVSIGDGPVRELSVNARPMFGNDLDDRPGAVATFTDVTAERAMIREMETLSVVVRQSDYSVLMVSPEGRITWVNSAFEQLTGYSAPESIGARPAELLHGVHTSQAVVAELRASLQREQGFHGELLHYRKDGTPYWSEITLTPLHDASQSLSGYVGLSRDVTARRIADRERQTLAAALSVAADGMAVVDVGGSLEFVNHAFVRQHGARPGDLEGQPWLHLYASDESNRLTTAMRTELMSVGFWHGEVTGRRVSGESFPQDVTLTLLPQGGVVIVARDVSERRAAEDRLKFLSTRDELTGLLNRRGFMQAANQHLSDAKRDGCSCALLYGDLDSFKRINDHFGHATGDLALQEMAKLLSRTFRDTDLVARLGGDEFTVLLFDVTREDVERLVRRLETQVNDHNATRAGTPADAWNLGLSLGVAYADASELTGIDTLMRNADAAQYARKSQRKSARRAA